MPDDATQRTWRERIALTGKRVIPQIDRNYFRSLYGREPGGVLYERASNGPGVVADVDVQHLGERLSLPPLLEPLRAEIAANLRSLELVESYTCCLRQKKAGTGSMPPVPAPC